MNRNESFLKTGTLADAYLAPQSRSHLVRPYKGHKHFWQRALSRRSFFGAAAGVVGGASVLLADPPSSGAGPRPIPGGIQPFGPGTEVFHLFPIMHGVEPSSITDFNGFLGAAEIQGSWSVSGQSAPVPIPPTTFDADMRFMSGEHVGLDGRHRQGVFGFI